MNTTKNHSRNFFLSLLYSNAFAKVFEGLLFHKVEVRSRNPIYFDFTLMRYLLRTKAEKLLLCRAINERTFVFLRVEKKDIQSRISVHQNFPPIYLNLIFTILQFEISSLMNRIFSLFQTEFYRLQQEEKNHFKPGKI